MNNNSDFRIIVSANLTAERAKRALHAPKPSGLAALSGLRYERRVRRELLRHISATHFLSLEHNPWFTFSDIYGAGACCPDFLIWQGPEDVLVTEVKLTWVPSARQKLTHLYLPVVSKALNVNAHAFIIVRNSAPEAPKAEHTLRAALASNEKLFQWFDNGPMLW